MLACKDNRYFPILRGRKSDIDALSKLGTQEASQVIPILILGLVDSYFWNFYEEPEDAIENAERVAGYIRRGSLQCPEILLDFTELLKRAMPEHIPHILEVLSPWALGLPVKPVLTLSGDFYSVEKLFHFFSEKYDGVSLRFCRNAFPQVLFGVVRNRVEEYIVKAPYSIVDFEQSANDFLVCSGLLKLYQSITRNKMSSEKGLVLSGTSIPSINMCDKSYGVGCIEFRRYEHVRNAEMIFPEITNVCFSDHTVFPLVNGRSITGGRKAVRYTTDHGLIFPFGPKIKIQDPDVYSNLCRMIVEDENYKGVSFSWGDSHIMECARGLISRNQTTWISAAINHHITSVVKHLRE
ncbi:hypothetical protein [Azospirillum sp. SYSU D00513]|uniref:beta family protein n=1 Tax=Azospirillum sp. SYSU D00513 TaxID=2812561 RepID=UPI001A97BC3E|nr:hypothetical protein [Azospirillum sp. SYSU D00513]